MSRRIGDEYYGSKTQAEVEGGLYHIITHGNNRQSIFGDNNDYQKMLSLLTVQKAKLPFFLYAYCMMNHVHLLVERRKAAISRVVHRLLTGYSRYYNKKNGRVGHLFQKRYKAILCQTDQYLAELVRYIHLNPVRAKIVSNPAAFRYSSHRAYLGMDENALLDTEPVLRHFGATKKVARERFRLFVCAGIQLRHRGEYYPAEEGRILGPEEFVEETKSRVGEIGRGARAKVKSRLDPDLDALIKAVAKASGLTMEDFCSRRKTKAVVSAKEAMTVVAHEIGAINTRIAKQLGVDSSAVSRRLESGRTRIKEEGELQKLVTLVRRLAFKVRYEE